MICRRLPDQKPPNRRKSFINACISCQRRDIYLPSTKSRAHRLARYIKLHERPGNLLVLMPLLPLLATFNVRTKVQG